MKVEYIGATIIYIILGTITISIAILVEGLLYPEDHSTKLEASICDLRATSEYDQEYIMDNISKLVETIGEDKMLEEFARAGGELISVNTLIDNHSIDCDAVRNHTDEAIVDYYISEGYGLQD